LYNFNDWNPEEGALLPIFLLSDAITHLPFTMSLTVLVQLVFGVLQSCDLNCKLYTCK